MGVAIFIHCCNVCAANLPTPTACSYVVEGSRHTQHTFSLISSIEHGFTVPATWNKTTGCLSYGKISNTSLILKSQWVRIFLQLIIES